MTLRTRIADWLLAGRQEPPPRRWPHQAPGGRRLFDAAQTSDILAGFRSTNSSIDQDILSQLDRLRGRSRNLAQNNDHMRRFLQMCVANIVGPQGFTLQCQARDGDTPDGLANRLIERSFAEWARRGTCDVTGALSFVDVQSLAVETTARDGECLVRRVRGKGVKNKWRFALQVIDIDRLPVNMNRHLGNGGAIRMGVELDAVGRPVAYHLLTAHPGNVSGGDPQRTERVPAEDVIHLFRPMRPEQRRGVPWAHTAMIRLEMLGKFEDAAVVAARKGAETLGFFVTPDGQPAIVDALDSAGNPITTSVPGQYDTLPAGTTFAPHDTKYPSDNYGPFLQWCLRSIASGLGVAYVSLANDLTGVSYSSIRSGVLEERDMWMGMQNWFSEAFLRAVFLDWLQTSLLAGAITYPQGATLPAAKLEKFSEHTWQARRWAWVDPLKDVQANIEAVKAGLKSRRAVIAEQGDDIEDVWQQLAAEEALASSLGIKVDAPAATQALAPDQTPPANVGG